MRGKLSEYLYPHPAAATFSPSGRRNKQHPLAPFLRIASPI